MGEVYKPEDAARRREGRMRDTGHVPQPITPTNLDDLLREVRELRADVEKIKKTLRDQGIPV